ncbi:acyl-CoA dehydrogenase/oxidase [Desarmillaria tabescens]|uniref:Acyl-CoA dehydrogenase/oxidase n=1 Tax=Armillaria tabescens TaxID=1929756 RepID=A0AA39T4K3_ARMTA|nr:acyl-CoA dehydrogenase/oxidase [Desarmillaria tabescens]KAK0464261.1 acyl-CoA dehydrogenase/oxidase [Desarmillaria tabescens]
MRVEEGFQQPPFVEGNAFTTDPALPSLLKRILPVDVQKDILPDLVRFGEEVVTNIRAWGPYVSNPQVVQYDQWGRHVNELRTSEGFRELKAAAQREGLPGIFYERTYGEYSRIYGFAKATLMSGDEHTVFCPLSMTDGAARVIELMGTKGMKEHVFPRLISRDPSLAYVSGQWMTERPGGSDVSQTETVAASTGTEHTLGLQYSLNGFKWFSSATESDVAVALARTGKLEDVSRGLSLFLVPLRVPLLRRPSDPRPDAASNKVYLHRLKTKIGTHALPTAELSLEGSEAYLVGELNQGVKSIAPVLNITRLWSSIASLGSLRRCLAIATSYADVRRIQSGTGLLRDTPLHVAQLADISLTYRALMHLTFGVIRLMGKAECQVATPEEERLVRMLTPTVKAFNAERACAAMEEAMVTLGGAGYMEENQIGRLIRDRLVEKIWEGTVTVLSLDVVRAVRDPLVLIAFTTWAQSVMASCPDDLRVRIIDALDTLKHSVDGAALAYKAQIPSLLPRHALILLGNVASSLFLLEHAIWSHKTNQDEAQTDSEVFKRWVLEGGSLTALRGVQIIQGATAEREAANTAIVFGTDAAKFRAKL